MAIHEHIGGCQNFWKAKAELVKRHGLAREVPQEVQELLAAARARQKPRRGGGEGTAQAVVHPMIHGSPSVHKNAHRCTIARMSCAWISLIST